MTLFQMFLQTDAAYNCVGEMGELGIVEFRDVSCKMSKFNFEMAKLRHFLFL